jgi:hypothetical protein
VIFVRFMRWLRRAFPEAKIAHTSWAVASSDSMYALEKFRDSLQLNETIDLAFFDPCKSNFMS